MAQIESETALIGLDDNLTERATNRSSQDSRHPLSEQEEARLQDTVIVKTIGESGKYQKLVVLAAFACLLASANMLSLLSYAAPDPKSLCE